MSGMPTHSHAPVGSPTATQGLPTGNLWANGNQPGYAPTANTTMNPSCVANTGGSQPHDNMSPYLVLTFCIALQGIFPSRN